MAKNILIPLDGSVFSEQALDYARAIAERQQAQVHLVRVHTPGTAPLDAEAHPYYASELDEELRKGECSYLERTALEFRASGLTAQIRLLSGLIVPELEAYVREHGIDLIIMTTHGRGGLSRAWLGSVADSLVRQVNVPLLLLRPRSTDNGAGLPFTLRHVLVPLDGSAASERILDQTLELADLTRPRFTLMQVVPPPSQIPVPESIIAFSDNDASLQQVRDNASDYLEQTAARLRAHGYSVDTRVVIQSQTAFGILEQALDCGADLIAMATHGRTGWMRVALGSVADKVLRGTSVPLLLQRPEGSEVTQPARGRENLKVEPMPTSLSTSTVPPWASTMPFTMAKPSPMP